MDDIAIEQFDSCAFLNEAAGDQVVILPATPSKQIGFALSFGQRAEFRGWHKAIALRQSIAQPGCRQLPEQVRMQRVHGASRLTTGHTNNAVPCHR